MNTVQPRNLREASLWSSSLRSAWNAHLRRKPRGREFSKLSREHDGYTRWMVRVVTCNERVREIGWKRGARVYVLVERSWYTGAPKPPRTTAGSATPLAACRRIPTTAPRPPPRFSIRVEGKMGGKVVRCMIGRLLDWYRSKGCFWFYLHCVDTFADDGGFFNGAEQSMEARIDNYLEIYFFFYYYRVLYLSCLVLWNFCTCTTASFFVILINCNLVILSSFKLEVFRSNF